MECIICDPTDERVFNKHLRPRREWHKDGGRHRDYDLPAVIGPNGKFWYKNGLLHRDNGEPAIVYFDGKKQWFRNGIMGEI